MQTLRDRIDLASITGTTLVLEGDDARRIRDLIEWVAERVRDGYDDVPGEGAARLEELG